ncbi:hypothetical protein [Actinoplanes sp. RD1]|uniref:hypothetical protein n=1 Tax=Actinoplanes sp. RD1 TaxID=3064538 RepID=UPI0027408D0E|nr:hypothetical protein [Actinoplanes sp. RD1]
MPEKIVYSGQALPAEKNPTASGSVGPNTSEVVDALTQFVGIARDPFAAYQAEKTKRAQISAARDTEIARIKAAKTVLRDYFDHVYLERREVHTRLLDSLDRALEAGNTDAIPGIINGIVDMARVSPLAHVGDIGDLIRAMKDPNTVIEL